MQTYNMKTGREVCWDMHLVEKAENIRLDMHKPIKKNVALEMSEKWEGTTCGYPSVVKVGDKFRFYYRSSGFEGKDVQYYCMAESDDGITFTRPELCMFEFDGSKKNNIHFTEDRLIDNFSIHLDTNPACPPDAKFKALSLRSTKTEEGHKQELLLYKSADGIRFEFVKVLPVKGVFDSHNILLWDDKNEIYKMYIRNFHDAEGNDVVYEPVDAVVEPFIRDIRLTTSKDLENWSTPEKIRFEEGSEDLQLYTSQIIKYHRADIYIGMPTRYSNRVHDAAASNFCHLPSWGGIRKERLKEGSRLGTAATDCTLMTSRGGFNFKRRDEAFLTPGLEGEYNWVYGDGYMSHGVIETPVEGNPGKYELSFYSADGYYYSDLKFIRYTVRLDGFFSWRGDFCGGSVLTKPLTFEGSSMSINFATSALGALRIEICDLEGNAIEGYDSGILFGDSLDRGAKFEKALKELSGKPVRIKFTLKDADLYSFKFNE